MGAVTSPPSGVKTASVETAIAGVGTEYALGARQEACLASSARLTSTFGRAVQVARLAGEPARRGTAAPAAEP